MKGYIILFFSLALFACNSSSNKNTDKTDSTLLPTTLVSNPNTANGMDSTTLGNKPTIDFADTFHAFGIINADEKVEYDFTFTNNGKSPLIISNAEGSCGCTAASYPHDPIAPGKTAVMKVLFNSQGKSGHQEKSVAVTTNSKTPMRHLYITADIKGGSEEKVQ